MSGPLPRLPLWCVYPFLPTELRPSQQSNPVGAQHHPYYSNFSMGEFRGCSHSLMFKPADLLATQVAPTAANISWLSSRDFYIRTPHGSLPPRAPDMLTVRFGQLTVRGLAPLKIRSLVGCSMFVFFICRLVSRRFHIISTIYPLAPAHHRTRHPALWCRRDRCR